MAGLFVKQGLTVAAKVSKLRRGQFCPSTHGIHLDHHRQQKNPARRGVLSSGVR